MVDKEQRLHVKTTGTERAIAGLNSVKSAARLAAASLEKARKPVPITSMQSCGGMDKEFALAFLDDIKKQVGEMAAGVYIKIEISTHTQD